MGLHRACFAWFTDHCLIRMVPPSAIWCVRECCTHKWWLEKHTHIAFAIQMSKGIQVKFYWHFFSFPSSTLCVCIHWFGVLCLFLFRWILKMDWPIRLHLTYTNRTVLFLNSQFSSPSHLITVFLTLFFHFFLVRSHRYIRTHSKFTVCLRLHFIFIFLFSFGASEPLYFRFH